jgi:hypothetical protein
MGILKSETIGVTSSSGSNGSAAGNADSATFVGEIAGVYFNYHANAPATTDVVLTDKRTGVEILRINNANTDVYKVPGIGAVDNANAALLSATANGVHARPYHVDQGVNVAIAGANTDSNQVVATVFYRK